MCGRGSRWCSTDCGPSVPCVLVGRIRPCARRGGSTGPGRSTTSSAPAVIRPFVVVGGEAAHPHHGVERRRAAERLAARPVHRAVLERAAGARCRSSSRTVRGRAWRTRRARAARAPSRARRPRAAAPRRPGPRSGAPRARHRPIRRPRRCSPPRARAPKSAAGLTAALAPARPRRLTPARFGERLDQPGTCRRREPRESLADLGAGAGAHEPRRLRQHRAPSQRRRRSASPASGGRAGTARERPTARPGPAAGRCARRRCRSDTSAERRAGEPAPRQASAVRYSKAVHALIAMAP